MPKQSPDQRRKSFSEVALGYQLAQAQQEADRCLQCKKPLCVRNCPVEINIPSFLELIVKGDITGAYRKIKEKNSLPAICGRVCPQENQCEGHCIVGKKGEPIAIGALERFCADWVRNNLEEPVRPKVVGASKEKVAVVGSGPSGLTVAADLAQLGYSVTIFEAFHAPGGVLRYGIPEFRLPKSIVDQEIQSVVDLGVDLQTNVLIGQTITLPELFEEHNFQAVFIGTGAGLPRFLNIPGENYNGVYSANEFLTRVNLMKAYRFPEHETPVKIGKKVAVIGAGNVAMDAARTAARLGAEEVNIIYRRSREEMPARHEEIENAEEEGIIFRLLTNPLEIAGDEQLNVTGVVCQQMALGEPDESGRRRPYPVADSRFTLEVDTVIVAIGQGPNPILLRGTKDLQLNARGYIEVDPDTMMTSIPGVFAAGDIVTGAATVIAAMGEGRRAARAIDQYLSSKRALLASG